jgi:catechol 2,3-dioxygenase
VTFYRDLIGLVPRAVTATSADLTAAGDPRLLIRLHERPGASRVPSRGTLGLFHFAILLPTRSALGRAYVHLSRHGVPLGLADHAVSEAIYLSDPDGLGIELYADRPRDQWHYDGKRLYMTTAPLDVEGLVTTAGDDPWTIAPPGTRLGHMHLHVGDLELAEAIYADALGFDVMVRGYPGALFFATGGYHHHLGVNTWAPPRPPADDQARLLQWDLGVPAAADAEAAADRVRAAGHQAELHDGIWNVVDPWGSRVRLVALN